MNKNDLIETIIADTFDIGVMVGETINKKHPDYTKKKIEFRKKTIKVIKKEIEAVFKLYLKKERKQRSAPSSRMNEVASEELLEVLV